MFKSTFAVNVFLNCSLFIMLCKLQSQSKLLGHFAVQWRIQGRGPGEPGSLLIFKPNWGPKGRKKFFDTIPPPPPYVRVWMTAPPPPTRSTPYLKVWFRHCRLVALPMLVYKIWRVNCDKQNWKEEKMGQKLKNSVGWKCPNYTLFSLMVICPSNLVYG